MSSSYFTIKINEHYRSLLGVAINGTLHSLLDLSTAFSRKVFASRLVELDDVQNLKERINKAEDNLELSEKDVELLYTCHFLECSFAQDKEAFFKWFIEFESEAGNVKDSEDFRKVFSTGQLMIVDIMEKSSIWTDALQKKKQELEKEFGVLPALEISNLQPKIF